MTRHHETSSDAQLAQLRQKHREQDRELAAACLEDIRDLESAAEAARQTGNDRLAEYHEARARFYRGERRSLSGDPPLEDQDILHGFIRDDHIKPPSRN